MLSVRRLRLLLGTLLAADTSSLANTLFNEIYLVKAPFVPGENLVDGDLTYADFDGSNPIHITVGDQLVGTDPATQEQVIVLKEPVGGLFWQTTGMTNLPQTIYGFALVNSDAGEILASELLPVPVTLASVGDFIDIGDATMRFVLRPIS